MFLLKLSQQLKSGFNYNINWIKYQSKGPRQAQNQYLDCLINFQGVNRFFVLSFKTNNTDKIFFSYCRNERFQYHD